MASPTSDRHRPPSRRLAVAALALSAASWTAAPLALQGQGTSCPAAVGAPAVPDRPGAAPDSLTRGSVYWQSGHAFERRARGVGILETVPGARGGPPGYDWLPEISVPFYGRPGDADPTVWMHRGWWVHTGDASDELRPVTYRGMMETSYEQASLVVMTVRADGWIEIYVDIGPLGRAATDGRLWTHSCLLDLGETALELRTWEDIFYGPNAPPLSFLGEERHALHSGPQEVGTPITRLESDDEVVILEFQGDWARVRALIPGIFLTGCLGQAWEGRTVQGWIRWRDPEAGTLLWYPTRGC